MLRAMWRKVLRGARAVVYVGLLSAVSAAAAYLAFSQFVRSGVTAVPELLGLSEEQARARLADHGMSLVWSEDARFDETVPQDHVQAQRPRAGTLVKRGSEVTAIPSRGPQRIAVPALADAALQAAQVTLAAAGLSVGRTLAVFVDDGRDGVVVAQRPPADALVEPGAAVDLLLSLRSTRHSFLMPDLVKRDYESVRAFFTRRGFRLGRVAYLTYAGVAPGTVLRQFPLAGHPLRPGDVIALGVVAPERAAPAS